MKTILVKPLLKAGAELFLHYFGMSKIVDIRQDAGTLEHIVYVVTHDSQVLTLSMQYAQRRIV